LHVGHFSSQIRQHVEELGIDYLGIDELLRKYTRNIAPASLSALYDKFNALTDAKEKAAMSLVTEEEKTKGIVDVYNELPSFLTSVLDLVNNSESDVNQALARNNEATGVELKEGSYSSTISDLGNVANPAAEKAVRTKLIIHRSLLAVEGFPNSSVAQIKGSGKAIKGAYKFKPNRITLAYSEGMDLSKVHYVVSGGNCCRQCRSSINSMGESKGRIGNSYSLNIQTKYFSIYCSMFAM